MKYKEIEYILNANEWYKDTQVGSHCKFHKVNNPNIVIVPRHDGRDISIGVLKSIEKQTGLSLRR